MRYTKYFLLILLFTFSFVAQSQVVVRVDPQATGAGDGSSWTDAYTTLQAAIDGAETAGGGEVWVKSGTYTPTTGTDRSARITLKDGVSLYGGFAGSETMRSERDARANVTFLSGEIGSATTNTDNSINILNVESTSQDNRIDGFAVRDGYTDSSIASPSIGAVYIRDGAITITNCAFFSNTSTFGAGPAIYSSNSAVHLENILVFDNVGPGDGAVFLGTGSATPKMTIINNRFYNNSTSHASAAGLYVNGPVDLINNTFYNNISGGFGGALALASLHAKNVHNNIFWANSGTQVSVPTGPTILTNNIFQGLTVANNFDFDPLFEDAANGDFNLQLCSPAINKGVNDKLPESLTEDAEGNPRIFGGTVDIGALEVQAIPITVDDVIVSNINCTNTTKGEISITASGGTGTIEYSFEGGPYSTTSTFSNLDPDTYLIQIRDGSSCIKNITVIVADSSPLTVLPTSTDILCHGDLTGTVTAFASGSTGQYEYQLNSGPFQTSNEFTGLGAGGYNVTVRDVGSNDCTVTSVTVVVLEPAEITSTVTHTDVNCNGDSDGAIGFTTSGGTGTVEASIDGTNFQTTDFTGLAADTYTVTFKDANGCTSTETVIISEPTALAIALTKTDITCNGADDGAMSAAVTGGVMPYEYRIDAGNPYQSSPDFTGLTPGTHIITARDANGCIVAQTAVIDEPTALTLAPASTNVSCNGADDGSIVVTASGSSGTYEYQLNSETFQSSGSFDNLSPGDYTVTVRDQSTVSCQMTTATITITEPEALSANVSKTDVTCNGFEDGMITFSNTGGTGTVEASIDGTNFQTGSFTELGPDTYTVTFRDANGCTFTEEVSIAEPAALAMTLEVQQIVCNGEETGQVIASVTGGTLPYAYSLDGTTFGENATFSDLDAGDYILTARDGNDCTIALSVSITEPDALSFTTTVVSPLCNGDNNGSIAGTAAGGTSPYEWKLNDGPFSNETSTFTDLAAGTYTLTLRDANGCTQTEEVQVTEPDALTVSANFDGARVNVTATGGTTPYEYSSDGTNFQTQSSFALNNGSYTFTVRDANGCTISTSQDIVVTALGFEDPVAIKAYPNPVSNRLYLDGVNAIGQVLIVDQTGKTVFQRRGNDSNKGLDLSNLKAGVYIISVATVDGKTQRFRIVKK
ncbi:MAG: hypothetical protein Roseis2KO_16500 [Roseivirga sp.]